MPQSFIIKEMEDLYQIAVKKGEVDPNVTLAQFMRNCNKGCPAHKMNTMWNVLENESKHLVKYKNTRSRLKDKLAKRKAAQKK